MVWPVLAILFSLVFIVPGIAFAEPTISPQVAITQDIQNDPLAQEILEKIEKSKRWIEQIQQRTSENLEKQKELEEKRAIVLNKLQNDLKEWEDLWHSFSFDHMLEKALVDESLKNSDTIFDHPLKFTASKIKAGQNAMHGVVLSGGTPEEARNAYVEAAKITREEMFAFNILFNVHHNFAYYNQQTLFESNGQFIDQISGDKIREYYLDYRTNPAYLQANSLDKNSWNDLGITNPNIECRVGYVLVHQTTVDDYVCTTKSTSEMWERHNMGNLVSGEKNNITNPNDMKKLQHDRIVQKIDSLNSKINTMQNFYHEKVSDTEKKYDLIFANLESKQLAEQKDLIEKYKLTSMTLEKFNLSMNKIELKYFTLRDNIEDEQLRVIKMMNAQQEKSILDFIKNYESDSEMIIIWNSSTPKFMMK